MFAGCGSTPKQADKPAETKTAGKKEGVEADAEKMAILDWSGRADGEAAQPKWMRPLLRGNGGPYCSEYGISETYANHKWMVCAARNASRESAQAISEADMMLAVAQEMSTSILGTVGSSLSDGQKDAVRAVCTASSAQITGVGKRGEFWRKIKLTDDKGYDNTVYDYYTFYSCPRSKYNELLNMYLIELLKSKGLDETTVNAIKKNAQQILDDAQEQSERVEQQKERELKAQLAHEETVRTQSGMNPALAALLSQ